MNPHVMTIGYFFQILGEVLGAIIAAGALLQYVASKLFESFLNKRFENHKAELERYNVAHQIKFSSLHVERAQVIKKLYFTLFDYKKAVLSFYHQDLSPSHPIQNLSATMTDWTESVMTFSDTVHRSEIYFSKELAALLHSMNTEMDVINNKTKEFLSSFSTNDERIRAIKNNDPRFVNVRNEVDRFLEGKIFSIGEQLADEFREILGVEIKQKGDTR
jgi:hypothetical protein